MQKLQQLFEKMQEYTKMTEELPFLEFNEYYQKFIICLQKDYQDFVQDDLLKAKGICAILFVNAQSRAVKKDQYRKKFLKIAEKANFWQDAIKDRLLKEGLSTQEMESMEEKLWADDAGDTKEAGEEAVN